MFCVLRSLLVFALAASLFVSSCCCAGGSDTDDNNDTQIVDPNGGESPE